MVPIKRLPILFAVFSTLSLAACAGQPSPDSSDRKFTITDAIFGGIVGSSVVEPVTVKKGLSNPTPGDVLIIGGATPSKKNLAILEFFDPSTRTFINAGYQGGRSAWSAVELTSGNLSGKILLAAGVNGSATLSTRGLVTGTVSAPTTSQFYGFSSGSLANTSSVNDGRYFHTMTLLANGRVLITGGFGAKGNPLSSVEIFDPSTATFSLAATMIIPRAMHTATLLADGKVVIVGGFNDAQGDTFGTAEIYDPTLGTFTATTGKMPQGDGVAGHTATLLTSGNVLIAGGISGFSTGGKLTVENSVNTALLFDPITQQFTATGNLVDFPALHTATLLADGSVLIAGGFSGEVFWEGKAQLVAGSGVLNSAEIYNPLSGTFTCVGGVSKNACAASMKNARAGHTGTIFGSGPLAGKVLLAGGLGASASDLNTGVPPVPLATAELYDPIAGTFNATGSMLSPHAFHTNLLLQ